MTYLQRDQPEGVPPLELTGERTLPDVPEENYWYRRHVAVYEWIAERCPGLRVVDLACGEGYGSDILAARASEVIGVDANPEAYEHARRRYRRPNLSFRRGLVEDFDEPCDAVVFLQTIEHIHEPGSLLERIARISPLAYVSTPNRLTLAPPGAEKSDNPWHLREYDAREYRELLEPHFSAVEILGLFHARKLRAHELAIRAGWDRLHPALRLTKPFYDRFIPAISARDFRLSPDSLDRALDFLAICDAGVSRGNSRAGGGEQPPSRAVARAAAEPTGPARTSDGWVGDLAIVLHSHMPYVEGFGTYPFGEEWLFEAVARSHLPVLEVAERLTMTVTPVLADQLEADGVGERMHAFLRRHRLGAAERDAAEAEEQLRPAALAEAEHYRSAIERLEQPEGAAVGAFQQAHAEGRIAMMSSAATHAVLPKLATLAGRRLQVDAAIRSHRRRFGEPEGFWLPECAYVPGVESVLAERGIEFTCLDQSAHEPATAPLAPIRLRGGPVGFPIDWPTIELVWAEQGYPSDPAYLEYHRLSPNGIRLWSIGGEPYDPVAAERRASEHASAFLAAVRTRLERHRAERGGPGLCVFAIDTELLGAWWAEGPIWLREVLRAAGRERVRLLTLPEALNDHPAEERPVHEASWGEGKTLETWDSPAVADFVWAARRLELRLLRDLRARRLKPAAAERAARELLAVQSSDWAFMDHRGQAGDYPFDRAVDHAGAMLEAIESDAAPEPRMRNLAPDLSLAPLLEP